MFDRMEMAESIYEGVVEPSYKNSTRTDSNRADHSRKIREEATSSNTYSNMSNIAYKRRKMYVDHPKDRSKPTCIVNGPVNSSDECKILGDYGYKYSKSSPTKERWHEPAKKIFLTDRKRTVILFSMQWMR